VGQRQILCMIRAVGKRQQLHVCLTGQATALTGIASLTGRNHVGPLIPTTSGKGNHMVPAQRDVVKVMTAVQANVSISSKQSAIGERRLPSRFAKYFALAGYDAVECHHGSFAGDP
jgi:hypothetical protein